MTYQATVEQLYALGHELAVTPSHKFDLVYVRFGLRLRASLQQRGIGLFISPTHGGTGCCKSPTGPASRTKIRWIKNKRLRRS